MRGFFLTKAMMKMKLHVVIVFYLCYSLYFKRTWYFKCFNLLQIIYILKCTLLVLFIRIVWKKFINLSVKLN